MDPTSIGLCPQGLESPRCRFALHIGCSFNPFNIGRCINGYRFCSCFILANDPDSIPGHAFSLGDKASCGKQFVTSGKIAPSMREARVRQQAERTLHLQEIIRSCGPLPAQQCLCGFSVPTVLLTELRKAPPRAYLVYTRLSTGHAMHTAPTVPHTEPTHARGNTHAGVSTPASCIAVEPLRVLSALHNSLRFSAVTRVLVRT